MTRQVVITAPAEADVLSNHRWWAENHSREQADRWTAAVYRTMRQLSATAEQHSYATERVLREAGVRQAQFGLGRRPSHRVLYGVIDDTVVVYRVRAVRQDAIGTNDLT